MYDNARAVVGGSVCINLRRGLRRVGLAYEPRRPAQESQGASEDAWVDVSTISTIYLARSCPADLTVLADEGQPRGTWCCRDKSHRLADNLQKILKIRFPEFIQDFLRV